MINTYSCCKVCVLDMNQSAVLFVKWEWSGGAGRSWTCRRISASCLLCFSDSLSLKLYFCTWPWTHPCNGMVEMVQRARPLVTGVCVQVRKRNQKEARANRRAALCVGLEDGWKHPLAVQHWRSREHQHRHRQPPRDSWWSQGSSDMGQNPHPSSLSQTMTLSTWRENNCLQRGKIKVKCISVKHEWGVLWWGMIAVQIVRSVNWIPSWQSARYHIPLILSFVHSNWRSSPPLFPEHRMSWRW